MDLLKAVTSIHLNQAAVDKRIFDAETVGIDNLIHGCEAVDGGLAVDVLLDFLWFFFLPRCLHESRNDGIDCGTCALKLLDEVLH